MRSKKKQNESLNFQLEQEKLRANEYSLMYDNETKRTETLLKEFNRADKNKDIWREKAEKYEQALDAIEKELKECVYCESQECACDDFEECLKCTKEHILDFISKVKDGKNAN